MGRVMVHVKEWEHKVWFGGVRPWEDPALVEPYPGLGMREGCLKYRDNASPPRGSLQAFIHTAKWKGYAAKVGPLAYLSYTMCGRSIFQIENADSNSISIILDATSPLPRAGVHGIRARCDQAIGFVQQAIRDWKAGHIDLTFDPDIGLI